MPQVIIPKPIYPSQTNPQNLFLLSNQNQDINTLPLKNSLLTFKKLNGAFKLYKEKKYRNKDCQNTYNNEAASICQPVERKVYKLVNKEVPNQSINNLASFSIYSQPIFDYFDPNTAPTFVEQENKECYLKKYKQKLNQSIEKKQIQNKQRILVQKKIMKETEPQELQNQFIMVPEQVIAGDPFIIMKKTKIKQVKYIKNIENLTAHNKKKITKKDEHTPLKQTQNETLQKTKIIQQSFKKQKQHKGQELSSKLLPNLSNQCSLKKQKRTQCKQTTINDNELIRKRMREFQDNFAGPRLILHLSSESQSNLGLCDFESLGQKEVLPLIK